VTSLDLVCYWTDRFTEHFWFHIDGLVKNRVLPKRLREELSNTRLIFTVTTGRSGTGYLAIMLSLVSGVSSYHEPEPKFSDVMRQVQNETDVAFRYWLNSKLPFIASLGTRIYAETSHLFCKGFVEPLLALDILPDVIFLERSHRQVAVSLYNLGVIPGRSSEGLHWLLSPDDPGVLQLPQWQELEDYQLCYWYCLEIERRAKLYKCIFQQQQARTVSTSIERIGTLTGFRELLNKLELPNLSNVGWLRYFCVRSVKANLKETLKRQKAARQLGEEDLHLMELEVVERVT
jgi:hypothetical protein